MLFDAATPGIVEHWLVDQILASGTHEGIVWRRGADMLFGVIELDEMHFADSASSRLQTAIEQAYRRIFSLIDTQGLPHLWRTWNYVPHITAHSHGLERYRQFNIGRQDAFLACRGSATGNLPAACALGLGTRLSIAFIAGRQTSVAIENPRQVSAYHYPDEFGPRSPTFSRAVLATPPGQEILFISGTASIVSHQTRHAEDVVAQCEETLVNIETVIAHANLHCASAPFVLGELATRVYIRDAAQVGLIRSTLGPRLDAGLAIYLQADICRTDLLLEIEGMALHPIKENP